MELDDLGRLVLGVHVGEVGVDEVDQAADVLDRHRLVPLLKVVHVPVQNLHEELHVQVRLHTRVGDLEGLLQALEHALAVPGQVLLRLTAALHGDRPEEVGAELHGGALVGLLEELGGVEGALGGEGILVLRAKYAHGLEGANDEGDGGELGPGVGNVLLVDEEGLGHELVGNGLELADVGGLGALEEEAEADLKVVGLEEGGGGLVGELEDLLALLGPELVLALELLVAEGEPEGGDEERGQGELDAVAAGAKLLPDGGEEEVLLVRHLVVEEVDHAGDEVLLLGKLVLRGVDLTVLVADQGADELEKLVGVVSLVDDGVVLEHVLNEARGNTFAGRVGEVGEEGRVVLQLEQGQDAVEAVNRDGQQLDQLFASGSVLLIQSAKEMKD